MFFSTYKNRKLKVELWWIEAPKRKKTTFFVPSILPKANVFNICVLSWCIVYWIHFQNMATFTYGKTLIHTLFCLLLKSPKAFSVSLTNINHFRWNLHLRCLTGLISFILQSDITGTGCFNCIETNIIQYIKITFQQMALQELFLIYWFLIAENKLHHILVLINVSTHSQLRFSAYLRNYVNT